MKTYKRIKTASGTINKTMKQISGSIKTLAGGIALALLLSLNCSAQTLNSIQSSFDNYRQYALQEKIFVHTDKGAYMTGEIMWFKLYVVDGTYNKPLNLSKVAYVEVLDENNTPAIQAKVELHNGHGSGSLYIPVSINNGNYKFRAYTNWMKNFSPDFYFEKQITLINPLKTTEVMASLPAPSYDMQFFPEGGNLVAGLKSKVGFKAVGQDGKVVEVSGVVVGQHNDTVARFRSAKFGMGSFSFTPEAGNAYKATVKIDG